MRLSVRVALTPPDTHEWRNWKTSQAKNLVSKRRAGSNPASCTTMEPEAHLAGAPGCGPGGVGSVPALLPLCTDDGMVDKPVSGTGAQKACGFESRSVHHTRS